MKKIIAFVVNGDPFGKQRPKIAMYGGHAHAYTPKETVSYENRVLHTYKEHLQDLGIRTDIPFFDKNEPIFCSITAYFGLTTADYGKKGLNKSGREKIEGRYCSKHLDSDNIAKVILDALNANAYYDDKQIVCLFVSKYYTEENPRVEIVLERAGDGN